MCNISLNFLEILRICLISNTPYLIYVPLLIKSITLTPTFFIEFSSHSLTLSVNFYIRVNEFFNNNTLKFYSASFQVITAYKFLKTLWIKFYVMTRLYASKGDKNELKI